MSKIIESGDKTETKKEDKLIKKELKQKAAGAARL
jgi:hypothetical protein